MITEEIAKQDLEKFIETFRIDPIKRKNMEHLFPPIIELIQYEMLVVTEDGHLKYKLLEPICDDAGNEKCSVLEFKNRRIRVEEMVKIDKKRDESEKIGDMLNIMTGINPGYINKFTTDDLGYINSIMLLFTPLQR